MRTIEEAAKEYAKSRFDPSVAWGSFVDGAAFVQKWIPIEEELPEDGVEIIAKNDLYKEWVVFRKDGYKNKDFLSLYFTHWRPIEFK